MPRDEESAVAGGLTGGRSYSLLLTLAPAAGAAAPAELTGELKQWHKVTLTLDGPFARERDTQPNPFLDYRLTVRFAHESGEPSYDVPGYLRRRRPRRRDLGRGGDEVARAPLARQGRPLDLARVVREGTARRRRPEGDGRRRCPAWTGPRDPSPSSPPTRRVATSGPRAGCSTSAATTCASPAAARTSSRPAPTRRRRSSATPTSTAPWPRSRRSPSRPGRPTSATGGPATRPGRAARGRA